MGVHTDYSANKRMLSICWAGYTHDYWMNKDKQFLDNAKEGNVLK